MLNLTQHSATPEQIAAGVVEPADKGAVQALLTFETLPTSHEIHRRANALSILARDSGETSAMIGGAGFLMGSLAAHLRRLDVTPFHAFSVRQSTEAVQPDGTVRKVQSFRHVGFVQDPTSAGS